jgi:hypothetical protein
MALYRRTLLLTALCLAQTDIVAEITTDSFAVVSDDVHCIPQLAPTL